MKLDRYRLEFLASKVKAPICCDCGSEMVVEKVTDSIACGRFDEKGNRQYLLVYGCPNRKWYNLGHSATVRLVKESEVRSG